MSSTRPPKAEPKNNQGKRKAELKTNVGKVGHRVYDLDTPNHTVQKP